MSYVDLATIHSPSTGAVAPAAWGTQIRTNQEFLIDVPACSVFNSAAQTIATGITNVILTADSENYDNDAMHSTVTNNTRITFQTPGRYEVGATVDWAAVSTTISDFRTLNILLNGTTGFNIHQGPGHSGGPSGSSYSGSRTLTVVASDYVEIRVRQNSGGNLDVTL
ncbi:MAG: hypothetical protein GWO02_18705, partial [Gammaproteobacteria bacterium]|nr:hypothetical protein [Gammaproteobacteria bacterium]